MKRTAALSLFAAAILSTSCALSGGTLSLPQKPTPTPATFDFDLVPCRAPAANNDCAGAAGATITITPVGLSDPPRILLADVNGYAYFAGIPVTWTSVTLTITAPGYVPLSLPAAPVNLQTVNDQGLHNFVLLTTVFPAPPTRAEILASHESFQGAVLHTSQFGDLPWWPPAWVSLNAADREASYAQIASWGDTDITVSATWDYGEAGQPYGSGQLVPPKNYFAGADYASADVAGFRASVKDVIQHTAANGKPFVPRIFMSGDNGFNYYMWAMPLIIRALQPQPDDPIDLTPYVKLQMCYDSCVPGYAGAADDKSLINQAILGTRAACTGCVVALEFATGYSSTGDGDAWWQSDAAKALDEADWEGNAWPTNNWEQYWEILDRWLGPAYVRPSAQLSDPAAPFPVTDARFYLRFGTPRGPYGVQCLEPFTYQWVRGQVPFAQVAAAFQALHALGCPVIDSPASWPVQP